MVGRCRWHGRDLALAPCGDQLPAPAAAPGPGHPRHAGPERDRYRAGADAAADPRCACGGLRAGRRRRRDQERPRTVAQPRGRRPSPGLPGRAEQDRRALGPAQVVPGDRQRDFAAGPLDGPDPRHRGAPRLPGLGAEGPGRQGHPRPADAGAQQPAAVRARAVRPADSAAARNRVRSGAAPGAGHVARCPAAAAKPPPGHRRAIVRAARPARQEPRDGQAHAAARAGRERGIRAEHLEVPGVAPGLRPPQRGHHQEPAVARRAPHHA
ncbi:hypothetical protein D3C86_1265220 [compost metagenome]